MIVIVENYNAQKYSHLLAELFRLRARVFVNRLHWDVTTSDGMERDRYDDQSPVYLIFAHETMRTVIGGLRLLPTTGPTLVGDVFADTLPDVAGLMSPTIWECTGFCVDEALVAKRREGLVLASATLITALGEVALNAGIETILGNFDVKMLRLYRRIGCEVEILGSTLCRRRPVYLGSFAVTHDALRRIKARMTSGSLGAAGSRHQGPLAA